MHNLSELQVEIHIYKQITNTSQVQTVEKIVIHTKSTFDCDITSEDTIIIDSYIHMFLTFLRLGLSIRAGPTRFSPSRHKQASPARPANLNGLQLLGRPA